MPWIKRNLYFLIGSLVALSLMGLAGWYFYSKWQSNNDMLEKLNSAYADLDRLNNQKPHPGNPPKTDNIKLAKEQQQQMREAIQKSRQQFRRIPAIPEGPKVSAQDFSSALSRSISQLQKDAASASVNVQSNYNFSFTAQNTRVAFTGSLDPLSVQLGEIKAICDILFRAKVNSLDNLRRERVSPDDNSGPVTDYLSEKTVTNDLALLSPYEMTFRCFTPELAAVLAGFASSPDGLIVKTINVELAPATAAAEVMSPAYVGPSYYPQVPGYPRRTEGGQNLEFMRRYGLMPGMGGRRANPMQRYFQPQRPEPQPPPQVFAPAPAPTGPAKGGLQTVLDEKELKVTLVLNVVKLK